MVDVIVLYLQLDQQYNIVHLDQQYNIVQLDQQYNIVQLVEQLQYNTIRSTITI